MACTTMKFPAKNIKVYDRWTAYYQAMHVNRLLHATPVIENRVSDRTLIERRKRNKLMIDKERKFHLEYENRRHAKRILSAHRPKSERSGKKKVSLRKVNYHNKAMSLEKAKLLKANKILVHKITSARSTIKVKMYEKEHKKGNKLLGRLAQNSNNTVVNTTLDATRRGRSLLFPKPPKTPKTRTCRKRKVKKKSIKLEVARIINSMVAEICEIQNQVLTRL